MTDGCPADQPHIICTVYSFEFLVLGVQHCHTLITICMLISVFSCENYFIPRRHRLFGQTTTMQPLSNFEPKKP